MAEAIENVGEEELDRLYAAPLDRFVAERTELARSLKRDGRDEEAAAVRGLTKPSVPAWTVNQLARSRRADVGKLLDAGEQLREAHGAGADAFRKATEAERRAVSRLMDAAEELLSEAGRSASRSVLDRVESTLHAAAGDEEGRRLLEHGRLTRELEPTGFEALAGFVPEAPAPSRGERTGDSASRRERVESATTELREARDRARELRRAADDAEREWKRATRDAERAETEVERATERLEKAKRRS